MGRPLAEDAPELVVPPDQIREGAVGRGVSDALHGQQTGVRGDGLGGQEDGQEWEDEEHFHGGIRGDGGRKAGPNAMRERVCVGFIEEGKTPIGRGCATKLLVSTRCFSALLPAPDRMQFNLPNVLAGLLVGTIVGITGVGGGALMTPILVLLFGVAPKTAVGTDLIFASITKIFGVAVHQRHGTVDWQIVRRLAWGSLPAAAATLFWMSQSAVHQVRDGFVIRAVAVAMIVTAVGMLLRNRLQRQGYQAGVAAVRRLEVWQPRLTVLAGVVLGVLVTLTSIGSGALGTVLLVYLYPVRLNAGRLVGTDIAHAIPLSLIAGLGHLSLGNLDSTLLGSLLLGSIPGVLVGSLVGARAPVALIRICIACVLLAVAARMLAG